MFNNKKNKVRKVIFLIIISLILFGVIINIIRRQYAKTHYIAESNHNTRYDDRKLVQYTDFTLLQKLAESKIEYTKLFNEFDKFIIRDLNEIKNSNGSKEFYNNNNALFSKKSFSIEYSEYANLYKKISSKNIDFSNDYKSCIFKEDSDNSISFEIFYENNFKITGIILKNDFVYIKF